MFECTADDCPCKTNDQWKIDAPKYDNCFFTYFKLNERSHTLQEVADLLGLSISSITSTEKKAMVKIRKRFMKKINWETW